MKKKYNENPEWTKEDFSNARPTAEVLPFLLVQEEKKKEPVSLRLSSDVLSYFKSYGENWQRRLNEALQEYIAVHQN